MYILFDIGGTNLRITASFDGEHIEQPIVMSTPQSFDDGMHLFQETVTQLSQGEKLQGIAGGIAGPMDKAKTQLVNAPNLPEWINKPFKATLEERLNVPVFLENDAALAGLGEAHFGSEKQASILAYLTISTGVGGARIVDGKLDRSENGFEPGHQIVDVKGPECIGCKRPGHLEAMIGGASLAKRFGKKPEEIDDELVWKEAAFWLAVGLANTIVHWSPQSIVLGGSLMGKIDIEEVQKHLSNLCTIYPHLPSLSKSTLEDNGLYGGLALLKFQEKILS